MMSLARAISMVTSDIQINRPEHRWTPLAACIEARNGMTHADVRATIEGADLQQAYFTVLEMTAAELSRVSNV